MKPSHKILSSINLKNGIPLSLNDTIRKGDRWMHEKYGESYAVDSVGSVLRDHLRLAITGDSEFESLHVWAYRPNNSEFIHELIGYEEGKENGYIKSPWFSEQLPLP